jgi:hypothetical protein
MVFFGPRANAELVPKFHVALHASHAALPMVTVMEIMCRNGSINCVLINHVIIYNAVYEGRYISHEYIPELLVRLQDQNVPD